MSDEFTQMLKDNIVYTIDKNGVHIYIPLMALAEIVAKPFEEAGLRPQVEVDVAKSRIKITITPSDLRKMAMAQVPNSPQAQALLAELIKALGGA